jgi:hypothetical protein
MRRFARGNVHGGCDRHADGLLELVWDMARGGGPVAEFCEEVDVVELWQEIA